MKKWILALLLLPSLALADTITVNMHRTTETGDGQGGFIGTVIFEDSDDYDGVLITPNLNNLPPGVHGFHIHEHPYCAPAMDHGVQTAAITAGGHFDPNQTGEHLGPYHDGHLGDLPILVVNNEGKATHQMYAPRLQTNEIAGRTLMVHTGGDNYSDLPQPLGGGGARQACGVISVD